jgi:mRNA interferase HigB
MSGWNRSSPGGQEVAPTAGSSYTTERRMRIISRKTLREFWERAGCHDAEQPLKAWFREASHAYWPNPFDVKAAFGNASIVGNSRVVFNIAGNKYRLVVRVNYAYRIMYVRFIGTHREYDAIDVEEV